MKTLTPEQEFQLRKCCARLPAVPLAKANLLQPFVYHREYGVFYVPLGLHAFIMSLLLAFDNGLPHYDKLTCPPFPLGYMGDSVMDLGDEFLLRTPGAAFRSGVTGSPIMAGKAKDLTTAEKRIFGYHLCIESNEN